MMKGGNRHRGRRGPKAALGALVGVSLVGGIRRALRALFQFRTRPILPTKADHLRDLSPQMTERPGEDEWPTPPHAPEGVRWGVIGALTAIALSLYALGVIIAWFQLRYLQRGAHNPIPYLIGHPRINMLMQQVFDLETAAHEQQRRERLRLSSYGWSDRESGMIHVPVERAMEELILEIGNQQPSEGKSP